MSLPIHSINRLSYLKGHSNDQRLFHWRAVYLVQFDDRVSVYQYHDRLRLGQ